jgi:UDP-glucuronate 4-epimerase
MAPSLFTKAILEGTPIQVFNQGNLKRDFTFIDDIIDGVVAVIERIPTPGANQEAALSPDRSLAPYRVYNIGNHCPVDLPYFIQLIERYTEKKAICIPMPMQPGDVPSTYADITELAKATGFSPHTSIEDGLREFVTWYRGYYGV